MAVPTEVLNEDIKELKSDAREIREDMGLLKADIHRINVELAEIRTQLKDLIGIAVWGTKLAVGMFLMIVATAITWTAGGAWWASSISHDVKDLSAQVADVRRGLEAKQYIPTGDPREGKIESREPGPGIGPGKPANIQEGHKTPR